MVVRWQSVSKVAWGYAAQLDDTPPRDTLRPINDHAQPQCGYWLLNAILLEEEKFVVAAGLFQRESDLGHFWRLPENPLVGMRHVLYCRRAANCPLFDCGNSID